jgi:hypothetical protein
MINRECPRAIRNAWARALTAEAVRPRSSAMLDSEALEMTSSRSRSSSSEVQALQLFIFLVAISSGHARFRALDAAGLSFFASALAARIPLIGRSISFCPAAALRGLLSFAGSDPRSFAMLRFRASIRSTTFSPFGRAFAAMGLPLRFSRNSSRRFCSTRAGERTAAAG